MAQNTRKSTAKGATASKNKTSGFELFQHRLELWFDKNAKAVVSVVVIIALAVGGFFGYKYLIQAPKEEKAATALSYAQQWFAIDSFNLVLNGNGLSSGALEVIKEYGGTPSGNLAHYYAGISYLRTNAPKKAIEQLAQFDGKGTPLAYLAYGAMGDAYMDTKNADKGIEYYKKAAATKNNFIAPLYLFRAGLACQLNGKKEEAVKLFTKIKKEFPRSVQAQSVDKYLARLGKVAID